MTFFTGGVGLPARVGAILPFHDPRVQAVPKLFVPADAPEEVVKAAMDDYRVKATVSAWSAVLEPGPGVVRCVRRLVARTRGGWAPITVAEGRLAPADAWYVT